MKEANKREWDSKCVFVWVMHVDTFLLLFSTILLDIDTPSMFAAPELIADVIGSGNYNRLAQESWYAQYLGYIVNHYT